MILASLLSGEKSQSLVRWKLLLDYLYLPAALQSELNLGSLDLWPVCVQVKQKSQRNQAYTYVFIACHSRSVEPYPLPHHQHLFLPLSPTLPNDDRIDHTPAEPGSHFNVSFSYSLALGSGFSFPLVPCPLIYNTPSGRARCREWWWWRWWGVSLFSFSLYCLSLFMTSPAWLRTWPQGECAAQSMLVTVSLLSITFLWLIPRQ